MDSVVHFEFPYEDRDRMKAFYEGVFGWQTQSFGPEMGNYVTATTTETTPDRMVKTPGAINGGFFPKSDDPMTHHPSVVIAVNDIREAIRKVNGSGGKVIGDPMMIPGIGEYVSFFDTEGNRVSILQPLPRGGASS